MDKFDTAQTAKARPFKPAAVELLIVFAKGEREVFIGSNLVRVDVQMDDFGCEAAFICAGEEPGFFWVAAYMNRERVYVSYTRWAES